MSTVTPLKQNGQKKPRTWQLTLGVIALVVAYLMFVFIPGQRSLAAMKSEVLAKRQQISDANLLYLALEKTEAELRDMREFRERWKTQAPTADKLTQVLSRISSHAKQSGATIRRLEPKPLTRMASLTMTPISVAMEGKFSQVFEFLRLLDDDPMPLWHQGMEIQTSGKSIDTVTCQLNLAIFADNPKQSF